VKTVVECGLPAKASCYVQLHLQRGSDDTITPLQSTAKEGESKKTGERRDIPEIALGVTVHHTRHHPQACARVRAYMISDG
jgi:hypothetical protein